MFDSIYIDRKMAEHTCFMTNEHADVDFGFAVAHFTNT